MIRTFILLLASTICLHAQEWVNPGVDPDSPPLGTLAMTTVTATNIQDGAGNLLDGQFWINGIKNTVVGGAMTMQLQNSTFGTVDIAPPNGVAIFTIPSVGMGTGAYNWDDYIQPAMVTSHGTGTPYWHCAEMASYSRADGTNFTCNADGTWSIVTCCSNGK